MQNAQIVYTDVIPDTTINTNGNGGVYALDLNNDGITDFNITYSITIISATCDGIAHTDTNIFINITPLGANEVGNYTFPPIPNLLLLNSLIDSSSFAWNNNVYQQLEFKVWQCYNTHGQIWVADYSGIWNGADKYIPLRLHVSSQEYYGWMRLNVATDAWSFTVKDYAYNTIPDQPILAGQTVATGIIENSFASSINLFPNPATNHLTIALGSNNKNVVRKDSYGEITITDITGKIIYTTTLTDPDSYRENKLEVNTNEFAAGNYVVKVQAAGFIGTKKLIVEK